MKTDYTALDAAIVAAIAEGKNPYNGAHIEAEKLEKECYHPFMSKPAFRFTDARLQALRKDGRIRYGGFPARWRLVEPKA